MKQKVDFSINYKIILTFVLTGTLAIALLSGVLYKIISDYEIDRVGDKLKTTAQLAARYIDVEAHERIVVGSENSEDYKAVNDYLMGYQIDAGLTYIYTLEKYTEDQVKFVASASEEDAEAGDIGYLYDNQKAIRDALEGQVTLTEEPYTDEWGTFLSGFAPIIDDNGSIIAVVGVDISMQEIIDLKRKLLLVVLASMLTGVGLMVIASLFISSRISKPVISIMKAMEQAERGDLTVRAKKYSRDELGLLTDSFNHLMEKTSGTISVINNTMMSLKKSSVGMTSIADTMVACSEETSDKTSSGTQSVSEIATGFKRIDTSLLTTEKLVYSVSSSVEDMNQTVNGISKSAEMTAREVMNTSELVDGITLSISKTTESAKTASQSVNNVVTAVKEINASLSEVSSNCSRSMSITQSAKVKASETSDIIEKLNDSSKNIGKIIYLIKNVADQTNMLALNAAIEAAGAGESGKGFAVVANEVKELARKTGEATSEISKQIEEMNLQMEIAVGAVSSITSVVEEVDVINNTIAAAVTEQAAITKDISHSAVNVAEKVANISLEIDGVYEKAKDVAKNSEHSSVSMKTIAASTEKLSMSTKAMTTITEEASANLKSIVEMSNVLSKGANNIHSTMEAINASSEEVTASAEEASNSARQLDVVANKLNQLVTQFKI